MAQTFPGILSFAFLAALLVFGTLIRANVRFFQINLVPASLIGGTLGFGLIALDWAMGFKAADFTAFAFHFFTLSFMSLVLTSRAQPIAGQQPVALGGLWLSLIWVICLVLQALVGLAAISAYNTIASEPLSGFLGLIATHGFTQGPGQALALGDLWTTAYRHSACGGLWTHLRKPWLCCGFCCGRPNGALDSQKKTCTAEGAGRLIRISNADSTAGTRPQLQASSSRIPRMLIHSHFTSVCSGAPTSSPINT